MHAAEQLFPHRLQAVFKELEADDILRNGPRYRFRNAWRSPYRSAQALPVPIGIHIHSRLYFITQHQQIWRVAGHPLVRPRIKARYRLREIRASKAELST